MILVIILSIILWIVLGLLSDDLRTKKGYDSAILFSLFLGIFALIYNAGLPDETLREKVDDLKKSLTEKNEKQVPQNEKLLLNKSETKEQQNKPNATVEAVHKWRCPSCDNMISTTPCPHCGWL